MLQNIMNDWESSNHDKESKMKYMRDLHGLLMEMGNLDSLIKNSIVRSVCIDSEKIYLTLNDEYHNIQLVINERDYQEVPISILGFGEYERTETNMVIDMIKKYIAKQSCFTFLDIGANIGWYTLNVKKAFHNADVYSFEPSPETFTKLRDNLELNREDSSNAFNIGLYDKNDKLDFYYYEESSGASSLKNTQGKSDVKTISVDVRRLDDWIDEAGIAQVDFVKCDVEGAEFFVYGGGVKTLQQYTPVVFSEMLRKWSAKFEYTPNDIIKFFRNLGYRCYVIAGQGKLHECPIVTEETTETNYFFLHDQKHAQIIQEMTL